MCLAPIVQFATGRHPRVLWSFLAAFLILFGPVALGAAEAPKLSIVFINPGKQEEFYWRQQAEFMGAAAKDLGMTLEVLWAERNHLEQIELTKAVASRARKPDYIIVVNEKEVAPAQLAIAEAQKIKTFLILNDLTSEQKREQGLPRGRLRHWIGTLVPDNTHAGQEIADALVEEARRLGLKPLSLVALSGDRGTPASNEREAGLSRTLASNPDIKLEQIVYGEWEQATAHDKMQGLLARYPKLNLVWCANDLEAEGAIQALKEAGRVPGKDVLVGGLNWSPEGLAGVKAGEWVTTVGGHFMTGGFALVLIYDYEHGVDFIHTLPTENRIGLFGAITRANLATYQKHYGSGDWGRVDFKKFSKALNPGMTAYDFRLQAILENVKFK